MNKNFELLLRLDGLVLLRKGLELAGPYVDEPGFEYLDERIVKLRRQLPGRLLSLYDRLARQHADMLRKLRRCNKRFCSKIETACTRGRARR